MAQHKLSKAKCAIKFIKKEAIRRIYGSKIDQFCEIEIFKSIQSNGSNILRLYESFEDNEHFFLVTQFMPAGDLMSYLIKQNQQPLAERHVKKIIV